MRTPGVEPGSQAWEACMIPLHYVRYDMWVRIGYLKTKTRHLYCISCWHFIIDVAFLVKCQYTFAFFFSFFFIPIVMIALRKKKKQYHLHAYAGSRTWVTSMGGLYDTATLHALPVMLLADAEYPTAMT